MVRARPRAGRARRPRWRPRRRLRRGARAPRALARRGVRPPGRARAWDREADRDRTRSTRPRGCTEDPQQRLEADSAAHRLLESLGYGSVRVFREMRIELDAPPPAPKWPAGLRVVPFELERDALEFHAAHQEAFADHWDYTPRDFESWSKAPHRERALRSDALVRYPRRGRDRRRDDLHWRHVRRRLRPGALHPSPVAQAGGGCGAPPRLHRALLRARGAQRWARRRRGK